MEPPAKRQRLAYSMHHDFARGLIDRPYDQYKAQNTELVDEEYDHAELGYDDDDDDDEWDDEQDPAQELQQRRARLDNQLKSTFESIFVKYGKDFDGIGDEIDLYTGTILVNNGHIMEMEDERDAGDNRAVLDAFTARSEEEETSSSMEESEEQDPADYDEEEDDGEGDDDVSDEAGDEDETRTSSEDEMLEEDMILRGLQSPKTQPEKQRKLSLEPIPALKVPVHHCDEVRDLTVSNLPKRSATLPLESDILMQFGPQLGPEIVRYISQQRVLDGNIEPAWRAPSIIQQSVLDDSRVEPAWRAPPIPTATSSRRPILKSVLAQPVIERTPSPDPGLSIWAPEGMSRRSVGLRKTRCTFTSDDDALIVEWIAKAHRQGIPVRSERLWRELELKNPRHRAGSWKKRCYDKFRHLLIDQSDDSELSPEDPFRTSLSKTLQSTSSVKPVQAVTLQPAESVRPLPSYRLTSQRPSRIRRPAYRDSTLINWTDAVATIEEIDPEMHAGMLEDAKGLESFHPAKQESLNLSATQTFRHTSTSDPVVQSPPIYSRSTGDHPVISPFEETKVIPNSQSPFGIPKRPTSPHVPEASQRNPIDPSYTFSDDDNFPMSSAKTRRLSLPSSKLQPDVTNVIPQSHTRPSPILSPAHMDGRSSSNSRQQVNQSASAKQGRTSGPSVRYNMRLESKIHCRDELTSSAVVQRKSSQPEIPNTVNVATSLKSFHCPRSDCRKIFTKPWTLKSHLQTHERKDKLAAELAKTPKRSGFLEWDDFDELSFGPDDFILVSSKPKSRNQVDSSACAIRLKREENLLSGMPPVDHAIPLQKPDPSREIDLDDYDELAGDGYSLMSLPSLESSKKSQLSHKSEAERPTSVIIEKAKPAKVPTCKSSAGATSVEKRHVDFKLPVIPSATSTGGDLRISTTPRYKKVYAIEVDGTTVMRRRGDNWLNATHILKLAGLSKSRLREVMETDIFTGEYERMQGGKTYQGIWVNFAKGLELCRQYGVEEQLRPLLAIDQDCPVLPMAKVSSKRTYEQMITPSSSVPSPPQTRTVVEDSAAEPGLSSSVVGSSPLYLQTRQRDTAGISPQQVSESRRARASSNFMVLVTPIKREARDILMNGDLSDQDMKPRASSVVKTPGGTLRRCGLGGFRCERAFCMKCEAPTKVELVD